MTDAQAAHCKLTPLPVLLPVDTAAVTAWRTHVAKTALQGVLVKYGVRSEAEVKNFIKTWNAISGQQLGATLTHLKPANEVNVFEVNIPVGECGLAAQSAEPAREQTKPQLAAGELSMPVVLEAVAVQAAQRAPMVAPSAAVVTEAGR